MEQALYRLLTSLPRGWRAPLIVVAHLRHPPPWLPTAPRWYSACPRPEARAGCSAAGQAGPAASGWAASRRRAVRHDPAPIRAAAGGAAERA